jgi:hypothetical protein
MKAMHYTVTGNHDVDAVGSVILSVFATIFSWQEHAEWVFRMISLALACGVSGFVMYGYIKKYFPKFFK